MIGANTLRIHVDKNNEADRILKAKKFTTNTTTEPIKRAALGDLQNGVLRANNAKEIVKKDLKDSKIQDVLRNARAARPGVNLKIAALEKSSSIHAAAKAVGTKILTRSNSVRNNTTTTTTDNTALQRFGSSSLLVNQNKPKTVTTKLVENKLQQVRYVNKVKIPAAPAPSKENIKTASIPVELTLRREDSNLSRRSLSKIKAAISRDAATKVTNAKINTTTTTKVSSNNHIKNDGKIIINKAISQSSKNNLKIVSLKTHSSALLSSVEDIDADDGDNLVLVSKYVNDIYSYLYNLEIEHPIREKHLEDQDEVSPKMRAVLIDWINEVHLQFHLTIETFQMAASIIDRYLQVVKDTKRSQLQLVGVTALFIASKYEELFSPSIADFVYITDDSYSARQVIKMELQIFQALDCNLSRPLPIHFLRRFSKAAKVEDCHHTMSKYFLELNTIDYDMAHYKPSEIAAASLFLTLNLLNPNINYEKGFNNQLWTPTLEWYSRYSVEHLRPISRKIAKLAIAAPSARLKSVYNKYQSSKFDKISMHPELSGRLINAIINSKD